MSIVTLRDITVERVRELFRYDPQTGVLSRIYGRQLRPITCNRVSIDAQNYTVARIIWLHYYGEHPKNYVDHINRNDSDNRIVNLRDATPGQNQHNRASINSSGHKGVTWRNRKTNPWRAQIQVNKTRINLGDFPSKEAASAVYQEACLKYHGEFAQLGVKT